MLFFCGFHALFRRLANNFFSKNNFKIRSYDIIHTFKNYFTTMFSVFSFQFSVISDIQIDPKVSMGFWFDNTSLYKQTLKLRFFFGWLFGVYKSDYKSLISFLGIKHKSNHIFPRGGVNYHLISCKWWGIFNIIRNFWHKE